MSNLMQLHIYRHQIAVQETFSSFWILADNIIRMSLGEIMRDWLYDEGYTKQAQKSMVELKSNQKTA